MASSTHPILSFWLRSVQERLGHSDISLTLNIYSHVMPGPQEKAAEKIDELMTLTNIGDQIKPKTRLKIKT